MLFSGEGIRLAIDDGDGRITCFADPVRKNDFTAGGDVPFRVTVGVGEGSRVLSRARSFSAQRTDAGARLFWELDGGLRLSAQIRLLPDGAAFSSAVSSPADAAVSYVEYPVLGALAAPADSALAHPYATGIFVKDPAAAFPSPGDGVRYAPYPESFSGASMQFFALCAPWGGLFFMARDPGAHLKWLNFRREESGLEASLGYGFEDVSPGASPAAPYPFEIRFFDGGWEDAAQLYKSWATRQPWCAAGPLEGREHARWLYREVGLATFGIDASRDRSRWIRRYARDTGTAILHVLGPDWAGTPQTFGSGTPGGLPDWFPTRFDPETLRAVRETGGYFAPFEFDLLTEPGKGDAEEVARARQVFPSPPHTYSADVYHFHTLCPTEDYTKKLHTERDRRVTAESGADAMYYDISASNLLHVCLRTDHRHAPGGGPVLTGAYRALYESSKAACREVKGTVFPVGTEMINEVFLPAVDFYQARAGALPCSALELWSFRELIARGQAEVIPLFAYVYHEYGAVRLDGWGKLVEETGDLFYDSAAKIFLWGGLYELNYEYSPAEALDGEETSGEEHYYRFRPFGYEYAPGRARYLRQFAALRTGKGNPYLAYGRMRKAPRAEVPLRRARYYHYNHGEKEIFAGEIDVPAVRFSAWETAAPPARYAVFCANSDLFPHAVTLTLGAADFPGAERAVLFSGFDPDREPDARPLGEIPPGGTLSVRLELAPRRVVMLELT